jgi:MSHA pilin protein MshB
MRHSNQGFTMLELVTVITIVGVLAAVSLPRFADVGEDAHRASVEGTYSALTVAAYLVHAQWVAKGKPADVDDLAGFGEGTVNLSADGWAVGSEGADNSATMTQAKCTEVWRALLIDQAPTADTVPSADYLVTVGSSGECLYTYQGGGDSTRTITYDGASGAVGKNNA